MISAANFNVQIGSQCSKAQQGLPVLGFVRLNLNLNLNLNPNLSLGFSLSPHSSSTELRPIHPIYFLFHTSNKSGEA